MRRNTAVGLGGAIVTLSGAGALIVDCEIGENRAGAGGAISVENASVLVDRCTLTGNAADFGGAVNGVNAQNVHLTACDIESNRAAEIGGAIYAIDSRLAIEGCVIAGNVAKGEAGTGWLRGSTATITASALHDNAAPFTGGVLLDAYSMLAISDSEIRGNGTGIAVVGTPAAACDARHNWWGHATGPFHAIQNPAGQGDAVSDHVDFEPWNSAAEAPEFAADPSAGGPESAPPRLLVANPLTPGAAIDYAISTRTAVRLDVYDVVGRLVATLVDDDRQPGVHRIAWQPGTLRGNPPAGVLLLRLRAGATVTTHKVVILR